jgi:hypothetical protein
MRMTQQFVTTALLISLAHGVTSAQHEPRFARMAVVGLGNVRDIASGDLNEDGTAEAVFALDHLLPGQGDVGVLAGDGDGGLLQAVNYSVGSGTRAVVVADMDGDGHLDVIAASEGADAVFVLFGDGSGTLPVLAIYPCGDQPYDLAVGDVNNDGDLDAVVANYTPRTFSVLFGDGTGALMAPGATGTPGRNRTIELGDLDEDGNQDFLLADFLGVGLTLWTGLGDGSFTGPVVLDSESGGTLLLTDVTGDGHLDVVNEWADGGGWGLKVRVGDGTGLLAAPIVLDTPGTIPGRIDAGDITGDGIVDLVAVSKKHQRPDDLSRRWCWRLRARADAAPRGQRPCAHARPGR